MFLMEHNAINENEELTPMGRMLAELPVDIQIGKMLIMASIFHIVEPVIAMAAALSVQSPFLSNQRCDFETMQLRKELISDHGDPLTLLNAYNEWIQVEFWSEFLKQAKIIGEQHFWWTQRLKQRMATASSGARSVA